MKLASLIKTVIVAAAFSAIFMAVDWVTRFPYTFPDLENYRLGFQSGWYLFSVINLSWIKFLLSEGLWVYGFDALWAHIGNIDKSFTIVSFASIFLISLYVFQQTRSFLALLFALNPAFVNLVIEQLRSGLAAGIFFCATMIKNRAAQAALFVAAISIHTSFLLFASLYYIYEILRFANIRSFLGRRLLISLAMLFAVSFAISYFRDFALSSIGDNRAYVVEDSTSGILLSVAWSLFIINYIVNRADVNFEWGIYFFSINVFMMASSIMMGNYGSRFVAIGIPALAVMSKHILPERRIFFFLHYFAFSGFYFVVWANGA